MEAILDILFLVGLAVWSAGLGHWVLKSLDGIQENVLDTSSLAIPLGLGVLSLSIFGLGEVGLLSARSIWVVLAVGAIPVGLEIRRIARAISRMQLQLAPIDVLIGLVLIGTLLTALAPVTDGDALCYHLQVPKLFLRSGGLFFDPDLHETIYPLITEQLYVVALALRGPVACRLVQWLFGFVLMGLVTAIARPSLGDMRARWAGAITLLVPAISNGMGAPLNDVALAAMCMAAIFAVLQARSSPSVKTQTIAGMFMGMAIGVKYPALVLATILIPAIIPTHASRKIQIQAVSVYGATAFLVGCCWYVRAYVYTGNPVFPFFRHVFGGSGLDEVLDPIKRPLPVNFWNLLTAIGPMTLQPDRFDSLSHQFGPIFLFFLPALLIEKPPRRIVGIVSIGYIFLIACLTQRQSMRFVLTAMGPLSVGVAWLASRWWDRRTMTSRFLVAILAGVLCFETALALGRARHGIPVLLGRLSAADYLDAHEPTARVGRWVGGNLPDSARIIGQDHRGYYFPVAYTMELAHRRRTGLGTPDESPESIVATLSSRGFTHLLMCPPFPEDAVEFDPTLSRRLKPWLDAHEPVYREALTDGDGVARNYAIYDLSGVIRR